uniref:Uncharacterized protein n=1 Tax=Arion vulgaris TaxID=1028688 RepID=A0A0B6YS32_9EUPU
MKFIHGAMSSFLNQIELFSTHDHIYLSFICHFVKQSIYLTVSFIVKYVFLHCPSDMYLTGTTVDKKSKEVKEVGVSCKKLKTT